MWILSLQLCSVTFVDSDHWRDECLWLCRYWVNVGYENLRNRHVKPWLSKGHCPLCKWGKKKKMPAFKRKWKEILWVSDWAVDRVEKNIPHDILWPHASIHMDFILIFILLDLWGLGTQTRQNFWDKVPLNIIF